jgi:phosphoribosylamine---glycine ligase
MADTSSRVHVLLIGGGGREHCLATKIAVSPRLGEFYATHTDNPGIAALCKPADVPVSIREIYRLQQFIEKKQIGLVVIGPEDPLSVGFADKLATPTCKVFGPTKAGAQLEADKSWAKQLMRSASIPTGDARTFTDAENARSYIESRLRNEPAMDVILETADRYRDPQERRKFITQQVAANPALTALYAAARSDLPVVKASGLAKGKGVVVPGSLREAMEAIEQIMVRRVHGDAGAKLIIEERLAGPEASVLAITDGTSILMLPPAQDHKRLGDGDTGPNTGGMGAFSPTPVLDDAMLSTIAGEVLVPVVDALRREGIPYCGVLFAGLMLTHAGPRVLEFNCRFGDPECQAIVTRLTSDLLDIMLATCEGRLGDLDVSWDPRPSCCVVLASEGYPEKPRTGITITGIEAAAKQPDVRVYHAGTKRLPDGSIVTNGGRVLSVTALGDTLEQARDRAYEAAAMIGYAGKVMRSDIARPLERAGAKGPVNAAQARGGRG